MRILSMIYLAGLGLLAGITPSNATEHAHQFNLTAHDYNTGTRQYLVYMEDMETGTLKNQAVWTRKTAIKEIDGQEVVEITQKWVSSTPNWNRELYSLNKVSDFTPISHRTVHGTEKTLSVYNFSPHAVTGDHRIDNNSKREFSISKEQETLNWELDMETFSLLPYELGKTFQLNFYHPGSKTKSQTYEYTVTGEETLVDMTGSSLECWRLHIKYGEAGFADFWIDKKSKQTIKMVEDYGPNRRYKILLSVPFGPAGKI